MGNRDKQVKKSRIYVNLTFIVAKVKLFEYAMVNLHVMYFQA
jgi:hypothetical protein